MIVILSSLALIGISNLIAMALNVFGYRYRHVSLCLIPLNTVYS